jgi:plastocyanin
MLDRRTELLTAVALAVLLLSGTAASAATIQGTIKYEGKVPNLRPIRMDADPVCASKHDKPVENEMLVLGEGQTMANIFVRVKSGLPKGDYPVPTEKATIDQHGCQYVPHVLGVMLGQEFRILNSDGIMHNVHALPKVNKQFNMAMPASRTEATHEFTEQEFMFHIKCDVHPWMSAYVAVLDHPFFDTTGQDGKYSISGLPAGNYEIEIWHEKLGTKTAQVQVGADETKTVDFSMSPPSR